MNFATLVTPVVYNLDVLKDGTVSRLCEQNNNPFTVTEYTVRDHTDSSAKELKEYYTKLINEKYPDQLEYTTWFVTHPVSNSDDTSKYDYTVLFGTQIQEKYRDPNEPIIIIGDTSPEARARAQYEASLPFMVISPIVLMMPKTETTSFDLVLTHLSETAVDKVIADRRRNGEEEY